MTREQFVHNLKVQTSDSAVMSASQNLRQPPGRNPTQRSIALSIWFNGLSPSDQEMLQKALGEAAQLAVFSFLCILDGVSVIDDPSDRGDLVLTYSSKSGGTLLLNNPDEELLHDQYNYLCQTET